VAADLAEAVGELVLRAGAQVGAVIDLDHQLILNKVTYPSIVLFYGLGLLLPERHWSDGLIGAAVGYGLIRLVADGYYYLTGRDGMGYGDGKLLALIGALLGWRAVLFSLFGGSLLGTVIAVPVLLVARRGQSIRQVELPFGPFIAGAAVAYLFLEDVVRVGLALWW
jgi:leader peptidase (prepilin peptidase)/N-methyltransferase